MSQFSAVKEALQNFKDSLIDSLDNLVEAIDIAEDEANEAAEVAVAEPVLYSGFVNVYSDETRPQGVRFGNRFYSTEEAAAGGQKGSAVAIAQVSFEK